MKGFFDNIWVLRISWLLIVVGLIGLVACGVSQEDINKGIVLILTAIVAAAAVVVWIFGKRKEDQLRELQMKKLNENKG